MTSTESEDIPSDIDNLITQIGDMSIENNFVNIKTDVKPEINPHVTDIPSTSTASTSTQSFSKPTRGYAGMTSLIQQYDRYAPLEKMRSDPINPFGIYLDIDCITNIEEPIDKWETALRIAVTVNRLSKEEAKHYIERSLVNNAARYWKNIPESLMSEIFNTNNLADIITKVTEVFKLEFCGEGNFFKDSETVQRYMIALLRLQLCDMAEIDKYMCFPRLLLPYL